MKSCKLLIYWCREGGRTLAAVRNTQVTDSRIDRIAQIARTDIFRHKLGTNDARRKTLGEDHSRYLGEIVSAGGRNEISRWCGHHSVLDNGEWPNDERQHGPRRAIRVRVFRSRRLAHAYRLEISIVARPVPWPLSRNSYCILIGPRSKRLGIQPERGGY